MGLDLGEVDGLGDCVGVGVLATVKETEIDGDGEFELDAELDAKLDAKLDAILDTEAVKNADNDAYLSIEVNFSGAAHT